MILKKTRSKSQVHDVVQVFRIRIMQPRWIPQYLFKIKIHPPVLVRGLPWRWECLVDGLCAVVRGQIIKSELNRRGTVLKLFFSWGFPSSIGLTCYRHVTLRPPRHTYRTAVLRSNNTLIDAQNTRKGGIRVQDLKLMPVLPALCYIMAPTPAFLPCRSLFVGV